jgi:hypothetical protein
VGDLYSVGVEFKCAAIYQEVICPDLQKNILDLLPLECRRNFRQEAATSQAFPVHRCAGLAPAQR